MTDIEQYLRQTIGLDSASIGSALIERTVRLRMKHRGIKRLEDYKRLLLNSQAEQDQLMESVVVTETWFFRDQQPFSAFVRLVLEEWMPLHAASAFRVLSVPCASGEEPYSLAIALLEAGVPPERFQIEAVDLSANAIARARRAVFKKNSFRGKDLAFRDRHFRLTREGYELSQDIRERVRFLQANLLDENFLADRQVFDFIFCRNLLIYFDRPTRRKALDAIDRLLSPAGILWVGAAEHPLATDAGFVSAQIPMAFACRKPGCRVERPPGQSRRPQVGGRALPIVGRPDKATPIRHATSDKAGSVAGSFGRGIEVQTTAGVPTVPNDAGVRDMPDPTLLNARSLADAGRFGEAADICSRLLKKDGASADVYYLLGLVRDAAGEPGGSDCYRKALYLDPHHYPTLLQMALLCEQEGDFTRARSYRSRAERAKRKELVEL